MSTEQLSLQALTGPQLKLESVTYMLLFWVKM